MVGWARDGFPIYGPYDDEGNLQRGATFGGDLDECNGKEDSNGNYGYYMTADPPFAPPCLRGKVGVFNYFTTDITCPSDGISNSIGDTTDSGAGGSRMQLAIFSAVMAVALFI